MSFRPRGAIGRGEGDQSEVSGDEEVEETPRCLEAESTCERRLGRAFEDAETIPEPPRVTQLHTADRDDVAVSVVFGAAGEPPREVVYRVVGAVLEAVVPPFFHSACDVAHYDVQFAHTDSTGERVVYRRVRLGAERAGHYVVDGSLDPMGLARVVAHEDDGERHAPVDWRRFDPRPTDGESGAGEQAPIYEASLAADEGAVADCIRGRTGEETR